MVGDLARLLFIPRLDITIQMMRICSPIVNLPEVIHTTLRGLS